MDTDANKTFPDTSSYYKKTTKRPRGILVIVVLLILLLTGIFLGIRYFGGESGSQIQGLIPTTPSPTESPTPSPTPKEEPTPTEAEDETPTPDLKKTGTPTPSPTGGTTADKNALTVSILNGSGVAGVAAEMKSKLTSLGYNVVSTGNADNFDYENVTIKVKPTKKNALAKLKSDLSADYTVGDATSDLASSETADAVVIVGK